MSRKPPPRDIDESGQAGDPSSGSKRSTDPTQVS